jgi:hypothetical protein
MRVLSCVCCDGICGPQQGCNCTSCQKLDEEETARTTAIVEKNVSTRRIMDSWLWGPQPCNKLMFIFNSYLTLHNLNFLIFLLKDFILLKY